MGKFVVGLVCKEKKGKDVTIFVACLPCLYIGTYSIGSGLLKYKRQETKRTSERRGLGYLCPVFKLSPFFCIESRVGVSCLQTNLDNLGDAGDGDERNINTETSTHYID